MYRNTQNKPRGVPPRKKGGLWQWKRIDLFLTSSNAELLEMPAEST